MKINWKDLWHKHDVILDLIIVFVIYNLIFTFFNLESSPLDAAAITSITVYFNLYRKIWR